MLWASRGDSGYFGDKKKSGRPKTIDEEKGKLILKVAKEHFRLEAQELARIVRATYGIRVGRDSIKHFLKEKKWRWKRARHVKKLTQEQKDARVAWATKHRERTARYWGTVIFSDEKAWKFAGSSIAGWAPPEGIEEEAPASPKTMQVWGCFYAKKVGPLHAYRELGGRQTLNGERMKTVLEENLIPFAREELGNGRIKFLQVNAPPHTARCVQDFLHREKVDAFEFPPNSPDLNPIENLWAIMKRRVERPMPENEEEFAEKVFEEWGKISEDTLEKLAVSMKERIELVIQNKGERIKF